MSTSSLGSSKTAVSRGDQIVQQIYSKVCQIIVQARSLIKDSKKTNKWFNLETNDLDQLKEPLKLWKQQAITSPIPLVVDIYLDISNLNLNTHMLSLRDLKTLKRINISDTLLEENLPSKQSILLESWQLHLNQSPTNLELADLTLIYKKLIVLFRSLYSFIRLMPCQSLLNNLRKRNSLLQLQYRLSTNRSNIQSEIGLNQSLLQDCVAEHSFGIIASPSGNFTLKVIYRTSCDFSIAELPVANKNIEFDENYFKGKKNAHQPPSRLHRSNSQSSSSSSLSTTLPGRTYRQNSFQMPSSPVEKSPMSTSSSFSYKRNSHQIYRVERDKRSSQSPIVSPGTTHHISPLIGSFGFRFRGRSNSISSFENEPNIHPTLKEEDQPEFAKTLKKAPSSDQEVEGIFRMDAPFDKRRNHQSPTSPPSFNSSTSNSPQISKASLGSLPGTIPIPIRMTSASSRRSLASFTFPIPAPGNPSFPSSYSSSISSSPKNPVFTPSQSFGFTFTKTSHPIQSPRNVSHDQVDMFLRAVEESIAFRQPKMESKQHETLDKFQQLRHGNERLVKTLARRHKKVDEEEELLFAMSGLDVGM